MQWGWQAATLPVVLKGLGTLNQGIRVLKKSRDTVWTLRFGFVRKKPGLMSGLAPKARNSPFRVPGAEVEILILLV